jgi:hypothetical protein
MISRISDIRNLHVTFDEEGMAHISEVSDHEMNVWWQACTTLLHAFPTLLSHFSVMFTDKYAASI